MWILVLLLLLLLLKCLSEYRSLLFVAAFIALRVAQKLTYPGTPKLRCQQANAKSEGKRAKKCARNRKRRWRKRATETGLGDKGRISDAGRGKVSKREKISKSNINEKLFA